jgi:hypothetical protein
MKLEFVDAQEMQKKHPDTFEAPTTEKLNTIELGSLVKVCTCDERFWTKVIGIDNDTIVAVVDNDLVCTDRHGLILGDEITFEKKNIFSIWED